MMINILEVNPWSGLGFKLRSPLLAFQLTDFGTFLPMSLNVANGDFCKVLLKEVEAKKHGINPYILGEFYPRAIDVFRSQV